MLEVSKNWEKTLGLAWPSSFGVALQPNCAQTTRAAPARPPARPPAPPAATTVSPTLYNLAHLNSTNFAVSVGSATLNLLLTDNNTKVLQSPRIRATDAQKATMKIGSSIPIATGSYQTGAATALVSSLVNTQFQYQDVGVNIEMTPSIHYDHDVTLKIKIEVSAESGTETISGVTEPIISQRVVDQMIRLREGEASILGGIQNKQEAVNWNGIPGLSAIPILKYIFGSKDHTIQDDDIVFVVVPHIVRSQELDEANLRMIDTGEGQSIDLRRADDGTAARAAGAAPAARRTALERPAVGTVPGQSAIEAAPQDAGAIARRYGANAGPAATAQAWRPPNSASARNRIRAKPPPMTLLRTVASGARPPASRRLPARLRRRPAARLPAAGASFALNVPAGAGGAGQQLPGSGGAEWAARMFRRSRCSSTTIRPSCTLVNVSPGDFLSRDGQAAPSDSHR